MDIICNEVFVAYYCLFYQSHFKIPLAFPILQ